MCLCGSTDDNMTVNYTPMCMLHDRWRAQVNMLCTVSGFEEALVFGMGRKFVLCFD